MRSTRTRIALWIGWIVVAAVAALAVAVGCIRRYPAPTTAVSADMPYSAVITWRSIELPPADEDGGVEALPARALRLALGPEPDKLFADTALVERTGKDPDSNNLEVGGTAAAKTVDDDLEAALALLEGRTEPIVILVDQALWPAPADLCARLETLSARISVAVGRSGHEDDGPEKRPAEDGTSRDPLGGTKLVALCPPNDTEPGDPQPQ